MIWSRICALGWHSRLMEPPDGPAPAEDRDGTDFTVDLPLDGELCDSCSTGDTLLVRAVLPSGGQLVFCAACWERHETALRLTATAFRG